MIYFDNNSTTRVFESTVDAMRPFLTERFANPASAIAQFSGITQTIQSEKSRLSKALGAESGSQFVVTSGATESNNLALLGAALANRQKRNIVISAIEHPSVMEVCEILRAEGHRIITLPITPDGIVNEQALVSALSAETLLVSVMMANNETGVMQPLKALSAAVKRYDPSILFHTDAT
ncbi:MAG: aminotransferase class V-fold PLP-dependent enzyme, partial [Acidobacteriia bacterium]|nr:aminotransferase class V-fold PLP-dependent enzyme [Terriglobia bacterium]